MKYLYKLLIKCRLAWYDLLNLPKVSLVLLVNKSGEILAVSRKDDFCDFGLCGGKVDEGENFIKAARRELYEETGLKVDKITPIFLRRDGKFICITFLANEYTGEIHQTSDKETGVVKWCSFEEINNGSFGEYNKQLEKVIRKYGLC